MGISFRFALYLRRRGSRLTAGGLPDTALLGGLALELAGLPADALLQLLLVLHADCYRGRLLPLKLEALGEVIIGGSGGSSSALLSYFFPLACVVCSNLSQAQWMGDSSSPS